MQEIATSEMYYIILQRRKESKNSFHPFKRVEFFLIYHNFLN